MSKPPFKGTIITDINDSTPDREPPLRLLHDLDAVGRMQRNTRPPAAERLRVALGQSLFEIARGALVEPERSEPSRRMGRKPAA